MPAPDLTQQMACLRLAGSQVIAHPEDNVEKFEGVDPTMTRPQSATAGLTSGKLTRYGNQQ